MELIIKADFVRKARGTFTAATEAFLGPIAVARNVANLVCTIGIVTRSVGLQTKDHGEEETAKATVFHHTIARTSRTVSRTAESVASSSEEICGKSGV